MILNADHFLFPSFDFLQQQQAQPIDEMQRKKLGDIAKKLEECLYKIARTKVFVFPLFRYLLYMLMSLLL